LRRSEERHIQVEFDLVLEQQGKGWRNQELSCPEVAEGTSLKRDLGKTSSQA